MNDQVTLPVVICPGCQQRMAPESTQSAVNGLNKTRYRCEKCGTETERIYKGD